MDWQKRIHEDPAYQMLQELFSVGSPSSREESMAGKIREVVESLGYELKKDGAGNLWVEIGPADSAYHVALAAHMDEIGATVTGVLPNGDLKVGKSGGCLPHKLGEGPVEIWGDNGKTTGILSFGSTHGANPAEARMPQWGDVLLVTGQSPQELEELGVRVGSHVIPARDRCGPVVLGSSDYPLIAGWTFDDRIGLLSLLRLLRLLQERELSPACRFSVVFTVHEEGGCHGAKVWAQRHRPDLFVAVDGCPIMPGSQVQRDDRPCVWSQDMLAHQDQRIIPFWAECAGMAGTSIQTAVLPVAYSDASMVYNVGGAARVTTFGHPRTNSHGYEVAHYGILDTVLNTLCEFVRAFDPEEHG